MAKVIIDTESDEVREYFAYLIWCADNGSKPGARMDVKKWAKYRASADDFLGKLTAPVPMTIYSQSTPESTEMDRWDFRETYTGIETVKE